MTTELIRVLIQLGLMTMTFYLGFKSARKFFIKRTENLINSEVEKQVNGYIEHNNLKNYKGIAEVVYPYEDGEIRGFLLTCTKRKHFFTSLLMPNMSKLTFGTFNGKEIKDVFTMERADQVLEEDLLTHWNKESYDVE